MGGEVGKTMGGAKGGETVIRIHYVRGKNLFSIKGRDHKALCSLACSLTHFQLSFLHHPGTVVSLPTAGWTLLQKSLIKRIPQ